MSDKLKTRPDVLSHHLSLIIYHSVLIVRLFATRQPLADGFVEHYAGRDRDVQRFYPSAQRDADEHVTALAHETAEPLALAAEQKGAGLRPVPVRVRSLRLGRGADCPDAAPLQLFEQ